MTGARGPGWGPRSGLARSPCPWSRLAQTTPRSRSSSPRWCPTQPQSGSGLNITKIHELSSAKKMLLIRFTYCVPYITANLYCKSRNLPSTDVRNYSIDLWWWGRSSLLPRVYRQARPPWDPSRGPAPTHLSFHASGHCVDPVIHWSDPA